MDSYGDLRNTIIKDKSTSIFKDLRYSVYNHLLKFPVIKFEKIFVIFATDESHIQ